MGTNGLFGKLTLDDCFRSLQNAGKGYSRRQEFGLVLAFLQEIRYEVPPDEIEGREEVRPGPGETFERKASAN